jgi:hypothetical protein
MWYWRVLSIREVSTHGCSSVDNEIECGYICNKGHVLSTMDGSCEFEQNENVVNSLSEFEQNENAVNTLVVCGIPCVACSSAT